MKSLTATFVMLVMLFGFILGFAYAIVLPTALIIFFVFHGGASEINGIVIIIESFIGLIIGGVVFDWFLEQMKSRGKLCDVARVWKGDE